MNNLDTGLNGNEKPMSRREFLIGATTAIAAVTILSNPTHALAQTKSITDDINDILLRYDWYDNLLNLIKNNNPNVNQSGIQFFIRAKVVDFLKENGAFSERDFPSLQTQYGNTQGQNEDFLNILKSNSSNILDGASAEDIYNENISWTFQESLLRDTIGNFISAYKNKIILGYFAVGFGSLLIYIVKKQRKVIQLQEERIKELEKTLESHNISVPQAQNGGITSSSISSGPQGIKSVLGNIFGGDDIKALENEISELKTKLSIAQRQLQDMQILEQLLASHTSTMDELTPAIEDFMRSHGIRYSFHTPIQVEELPQIFQIIVTSTKERERQLVEQLDEFSQSENFIAGAEELRKEAEDTAAKLRALLEQTDQNGKLLFPKAVRISEKEIAELEGKYTTLLYSVAGNMDEETQNQWLGQVILLKEEFDSLKNAGNLRQAFYKIYAAVACLEYISSFFSGASNQEGEDSENHTSDWENFKNNPQNGINEIVVSDEKIIDRLNTDIPGLGLTIGNIPNYFIVFGIPISSFEKLEGIKRSHGKLAGKYGTNIQDDNEEKEIKTGCFTLINAGKEILEDKVRFEQYITALKLCYPDLQID